MSLSIISLKGPPAGISESTEPLLSIFDKKLTLRGLGHIPLNDVGLGNTNILGQLNSTLATATQLDIHDKYTLHSEPQESTYRSNDKNLRVVTSNLLTSLNALLHGSNEEVLVGVRGLTGEGLTLRVSQLPGPVLDGQSRASIASGETESSNTAARLVGEELKIQQETLTTRPATQDILPATLLLEAVGKSDVDVLQREVVLGKLLETQDDGVLGRILDP
jgi:hypothetical protein